MRQACQSDIVRISNIGWPCSEPNRNSKRTLGVSKLLHKTGGDFFFARDTSIIWKGMISSHEWFQAIEWKTVQPRCNILYFQCPFGFVKGGEMQFCPVSWCHVSHIAQPIMQPQTLVSQSSYQCETNQPSAYNVWDKPGGHNSSKTLWLSWSLCRVWRHMCKPSHSWPFRTLIPWWNRKSPMNLQCPLQYSGRIYKTVWGREQADREYFKGTRYQGSED